MTNKELKKYLKEKKRFGKILSKDKNKAKEFLYKAGIYTKAGKLSKNYKWEDKMEILLGIGVGAFITWFLYKLKASKRVEQIETELNDLDVKENEELESVIQKCSDKKIHHDCDYIRHEIEDFGVVWYCSLQQKGLPCIYDIDEEKE